VVPELLTLIQPASVIDVGCGLGTWLAAFERAGVRDVLGVDGDYVPRAALEIPRERFVAHDLRRPLRLGRTFDLVVSLEVAEHLPSECATTFVDTLIGLGSAVLFSAAIPFQGGESHVNEQWPDYWARLFERRGFVAVDCLRRKIWQHPEVAWWYAQNILLYVERRRLESQPGLQRELALAGPAPLALVHPQRYLEWVEWGISESART
jgi:SAM-dependent methyltransferase